MPSRPQPQLKRPAGGRGVEGGGCHLIRSDLIQHRQRVRCEKIHSSSNSPGTTIQIVWPLGPQIGPTGPKMSIVMEIGPDSGGPGLLLLL